MILGHSVLGFSVRQADAFKSVAVYQCKRIFKERCLAGTSFTHFASTQVSFERGRLREILFRWWAAGASKWAEV